MKIKWEKLGEIYAMNTPTGCFVEDTGEAGIPSGFIPGCRAVERDGEWVWEEIDDRDRRVRETAHKLLLQEMEWAGSVPGRRGNDWMLARSVNVLKLAEVFESAWENRRHAIMSDSQKEG